MSEVEETQHYNPPEPLRPLITAEIAEQPSAASRPLSGLSDTTGPNR